MDCFLGDDPQEVEASSTVRSTAAAASESSALGDFPVRHSYTDLNVTKRLVVCSSSIQVLLNWYLLSRRMISYPTCWVKAEKLH